MGKFRMFLFSVFLLWTCFIGACRTTESQLYSPSYVPTNPYSALTPETQAPPATTTSKIPFLLTTTVILVGLIMVFASDRKSKRRKKSSPRSQRPVKKAKKV